MSSDSSSTSQEPLASPPDGIQVTPSVDKAALPEIQAVDPVIRLAFQPAERVRRVLVFAPLAYSTPHFETDLELAQRHLDLGDEVELVLCDGEISSCQLNPMHEHSRCLLCISRNLQGAEALSRKVKVRGVMEYLRDEDRLRLQSLPKRFDAFEDLKRYRFERFDAGMATLSSLIDFLRDPNLDPKQYTDVIQGLLFGAVSTYLAFCRLLAQERYDRVYIYNGRWSMDRSAVRACEKFGIEYYTHERGADYLKYSLYRNCLPHDMPNFRSHIQATVAANEGHPQFTQVGESFFQERRARIERTWFSFVKGQEQGRVPKDWGRKARRLVLFTSSDFELAAIDEGTTGLVYATQTQGASRVATLLAQRDPGAHLWVRVHPNDNTPNTTKKWRSALANHDNVTLVTPDAKVDSYAMLDGADRVLTFGSSLGLEAAYWGKAAICAEHSYFGGLDTQYDVASEERLLELLLQPDLVAKPREKAIAVGFYLNVFGERFRHFSTHTISDGEFKSTFRGLALRPDLVELQRRLLALYERGESRRSATVARCIVEASPDNTVGHSLRLLSLLKLGLLDQAIEALEAVAAKAQPPLLEAVLKHSGKELIDGVAALAAGQNALRLQSAANRVSRVLAQIPAFVPIARRLSALALQAPGQNRVRPISNPNHPAPKAPTTATP